VVRPRLIRGQPAQAQPKHLHTSKREYLISFSFDPHRNEIAVSSSSISGDTQIFASARRSGTGYSSPHLPVDVRERASVRFRHFLPGYLFTGDIDFRKDRRLLDFVYRADQTAAAWTRMFSRVGHVAPLRQPVPRFGILGKSPTSELGPGGENLLRALRSYDNAAGGREHRLVSEVSRWISSAFGMLEELRIVDVDEAGTVLALLGDERNGFQNINVANMGEGISQLLPIIARVLTTPAAGALLVEQPELHLHPAAQADLADLFIAGSRSGDRQYIVETHSEHLLLRLRRRIAEKAINVSDVTVLFVERKGRSSTVRSLDLNSAGEFEDWPSGFFDERYQEALAILEASRPRQ
jgi:hypothetical protein